jgi:hypothetical protein
MQCQRVILSSVASLALQFFSIYPIKGKIFYTLLNMRCVLPLSLQVLSEKFLFLRIQHDTSTNVHRTSPNVPVITGRILREILIYTTDFKNTETSVERPLFWHGQLNFNCEDTCQQVIMSG